jgi:aspartate carbamoyltransferase catalytic subunit
MTVVNIILVERNMDLVSIGSLKREEIEETLKLAKSIKENPNQFYGSLKNKTLGILFFEPSTRTRVGFSIAMQKLGGIVSEVSESKFKDNMSSPESDEDTLRVISDYCDLIALRSKSEHLINNPKINARKINCGNGNDEHPTQTLIDLFTIFEIFGRIDGISIALIGDLKNMRSAHSLILGLSKFNNLDIKLISPDQLKMPKRYIAESLKVEEKEKLEIGNLDVIYMVGFPPNKEVSEETRLNYCLNLSNTKPIKSNALIMNPLPRIDEISKEVDSMIQAKYFEQSANGLFVRMAILKKLLEG